MNAMKHALLLAVAVALPAAASAQSPAQVAEGAQAWGRNCTRCHNARPSTERTDRQWLTIVNHMRARANLSRKDATVITAFLKATNGPAAPIAADNAPERSPDQDPDASGETGAPTGADAAPAAPGSGVGPFVVLSPAALELKRAEAIALARYLETLLFQ